MALPVKPDDPSSVKVGKLLPSEVTGLYLSCRSFFIGPGDQYGYYLVGTAVLCFVVSIWYIYAIKRVSNIIHLLVYAAVFASWAFSVDAEHIRNTYQLLENIPMQQLSGVASLLISFVLPLAIPNDKLISKKQ